MNISRGNFLTGICATAAVGCVTKSDRAVRYVAPGEIKAVLLHLGYNMWCDWFQEGLDVSAIPAKSLPDTVLRSKDDLWRKATDHAAAKGINMIVVDLGEGLVYPSHPELAIKGSWSPDKMRSEIARLNALGLEVIPKLNFSTSHNGWLKQYRRMVSTPAYYRVCEELIADVAEVFGGPRFLHIGCDEEEMHLGGAGRGMFAAFRKGELWLHDFLHLVRTSERNGMRAWCWSDYGWDHPEFYTRCPKSVVMSNWYYDEAYGGFDISNKNNGHYKRLKGFYDLDKAGFDQIPCGTNWVGWKRKKENVGADDVIGKLVKMCRRDITPAKLKGFLMAPWASCDTQENLDVNIKGIDLLAAAFA